METPWALSLNQILKELSVSEGSGLSSEEAKKRLAESGPNSISLRKKTSQWFLFLKQVKNPVIYVLLFATGLSFFLGEHFEAWAILLIVLINTFIGYVQESKADAAIEALAAMAAPHARVLRDGEVKSIPSEEVIPGDVLMLEAGDYVPADARVILAHQLSANESILTGESLPVEKSAETVSPSAALTQRRDMLYAGTAISRGTGKAIVTGTGHKTEMGKIAELMARSETSATPLQQRLEIVSQKLLLMGVIVTFIVIALGLYQGRPWFEVLMSAISLAIAAIPEGLPTVVTIALVLAIRRMSKKKALIRKMDSVETLGATDIICTDKTGTLTTGMMSVRESIKIDEELFFLNLSLCNNASLAGDKSGDTTEIALLEYVEHEGRSVNEIRTNYPRLFEWAFDSDRKRMSVAIQKEDQTIILVKGAPETIIPQCISQESSKMEETLSLYTKKGMRVLAFGWKKSDADVVSRNAEEVESDLNFLGLVAMADAPREESREAIRRCQTAGIKVMMITGDHPQTAGAIAHELGIVDHPEPVVLTGPELDSLSEKELKEKAQTTYVYARVSPEHKLKLVSALKEEGHIVAMTGDGVNDAPALKLASIGVSMGKGGTEVARQASSMILTDDNFATIVDAVEEGRAVNGNIKRTLQYLLSHNLAELLFILVATIGGLPIPLLPVNLLWLNLVTDSFPSLALAGEKVPPKFLEESRGPSAKSFFDRDFYQELFFVAIIITVMNFVIYGHGLKHYDVTTARSMVFSFMVYVGLMRSFSCRSDTKIFLEMKPNVYHLVSVFVPIGIQILIQYSAFTREIFGIQKLSLGENGILLGLACIPVTLVEIMKVWKRKREE